MRLGNRFPKSTVALAGLVLAAALAPVAAAAADAVVDPLPVTDARAMELDPGTGRVFVSGDDQVDVYRPDGTHLATIAEVPGAWGMDAAQGSIWVNASTPDQIVRIDPVSLTVDERYAVNQPLGDDLTIVGGAAWFGLATEWSSQSTEWGRFDLATSTYERRGVTWSPATARLGTSTSHLLVLNRGVIPGDVYRVPTSGSPDAGAVGRLRGFGDTAVSDPSGSTAWIAGGRWIEEYDTATLASTGVKYEGSWGAGRFAYSAAHGGMLVGSSGLSFTAFAVGRTSPVTEVPFTNITGIDAVSVSPDGRTAYYLARGLDATSRLHLVDLEPTAVAAAPASVVAGAPTKVTVTGRSLGATTSVTVGGVAVEPTSIASDRVTFTTPTSLTAGSKTVVITGPTGTTSTTLSVQASTGATLAGTVRVGTTLGSGVGLSLTGGRLGTPRTATTAANGTYSFPSVPPGPGYLVTVHDPSASAPDQLIRNVEVLPNATTTLDVDLSRPRPNGAGLANTDLGSASVRDLLVDPGTGRVVVATGDEVDVLDADGRLIARIRGMGGARSLSRAGGSVYVGLANAARIVRIDLATTSITGAWPLGRPISGQIAASGGRVWFVDGDDQWTFLRALNPATGAIGTTSASNDVSFYVPDLDAVIGSSDRFLASSPNETSVLNGSAATTQKVVATDPHGTAATPQPPLVADAASGRVYDRNGRRYALGDLVPDGTQFPGTGQPARSPGHGGIVAIGGSVSQESSPVATHEFTGDWTATGLDAGGNRLYTTLGDQLLVHDLAPHIDATTPAPHYEGQTASIRGSGLGSASQVTVDGASVPFEAVGASRIDIDLQGLAPGLHRIVVTTPWGSTGEAPIAVLAPRAPSAPTGATATPVATGITVAWTAPVDDGGRPITSSTAVASPGGATCTTAGATTCTFTTLTPGASYRFAVRATNAIGTGLSSDSTDPVRMPTLPGTPTGVTANPDLGKLGLTWTAPTDDGGLPIQSYRVCWSTDPTVPAATSPCRTSRGTSLVITDLQTRTAYSATVAAVTDAGTGPRSAPTSPATTLAQASAPTDVTVAPARLSAHVSWTPPADDGGSPVTSYWICSTTMRPGTTWWSGGCQEFTEATTSATVDELQGGSTYRFEVYAQTAAGWSEPSAEVEATIPQSTPPPPRSVTVRPAARGLSVDWLRNDIEGGVPTTGHLVCTSTSPTMAGATCTTTGATAHLEVAGLPPGVAHYVTVAGINALGTGPASPVSPPTSPYGAPGAPAGVTATAGNGQATVSWSAPADGGDPVSGYEVTPFIGSAPQPVRTFTGSATTQTIPGLVNGVAYTFGVRARNGAGAGAASVRSAPVTPKGPAAPAPFATWDAFAAQQRTDLTGTAGTTASRAAAVAKLEAGTLSPSEYVAGLISDPWFDAAVGPATRLYWAYFGRIPDHAGLEFWARKRRTGMTLIRIAASFAGSSEFRRAYGSLSNPSFVDLVYRNVLGRPGDPSGRAYWIKKLSQGTSRGQVMITFSESGEYVRKSAGRVGVVEVFGAMLDRAPTADELTAWEAQPIRSLIDHIRLGSEYADRTS